MYTEIEISEFLIQARLKLGDLAVDIKEQSQIGTDVEELIDDATDLRMFLNAVNSDHLTWDIIPLYKRIEYFASRFDLNNKPIYEKDWLNKFAPVKQLVIEDATTLQVPQGTGFMFVSNNSAQLIDIDTKLTLNDL